MTKIYGAIVDVSTINIGENVTAAALAAATSVAVVDPTTFKQSGGQLVINEQVYDYTGIDTTAGTVLLATGLEADVAEDDRVELYPAEPLKRAFIDLGVPEGEAIEVTVPHALAAVLNEGMREENERETVWLEERNVGEFYLADVAVSPPTLQSSTYLEGAAGWALTDQKTQVDNLNVVNELGADTVSARAIFLDGQDLSVENVETLAKGAIAFDSKGSGTATGNVGAVEVKLFEFSAGAMEIDRLYRVIANGHLNGTVAGEVFTVRVRYTIDGSSPTTSSTILRSYDVELRPDTTAMFDYSKVFTLAGNSDNVRFALCLLRFSGGGVCTIDFGRSLEFYVEDLGNYSAAAAVGTLSQKSYADATPPDADPVRSYTKIWWATWTRTYEGNNTTDFDGEDSAGTLYQGYYSSRHGNHRSLIGFDYAAIQTALSGATIVSVKFTYRMKHTWSPDGATVYVSSHSYTSKPSTWSSGSVNQDEYHSSGNKEGSTYVKTLPTSVGTDFKNGTIRGLGFGPAPSNSASSYYCYMYGGETSSSRPHLTIQYTK